MGLCIYRYKLHIAKGHQRAVEANLCGETGMDNRIWWKGHLKDY